MRKRNPYFWLFYGVLILDTIHFYMHSSHISYIFYAHRIEVDGSKSIIINNGLVILMICIFGELIYTTYVYYKKYKK